MTDIASRTLHCPVMTNVQGVERVAIKPHGKTWSKNRVLDRNLVDEREAHHLEKEAQHHIIQREKRPKTDLECNPIPVGTNTQQDPDEKGLAHRIDLIAESLGDGQHPVGVTAHAPSRQNLDQAG
jgi:hypothetical protein